MRVTVVKTSEELVEITGFEPLSSLASTESEARPRRRRRVIVRQRHYRPSGTRPGRSDGVADHAEVALVRSARNRTGGGARARPAAGRRPAVTPAEPGTG